MDLEMELETDLELDYLIALRRLNDESDPVLSHAEARAALGY